MLVCPVLDGAMLSSWWAQYCPLHLDLWVEMGPSALSVGARCGGHSVQFSFTYIAPTVDGADEPTCEPIIYIFEPLKMYVNGCDS